MNTQNPPEAEFDPGELKNWIKEKLAVRLTWGWIPAKPGIFVRVKRTAGPVEEGWQVLAATLENDQKDYMVCKDGTTIKDVTYETMVQFNDPGIIDSIKTSADEAQQLTQTFRGKMRGIFDDVGVKALEQAREGIELQIDAAAFTNELIKGLLNEEDVFSWESLEVTLQDALVIYDALIGHNINTVQTIVRRNEIGALLEKVQDRIKDYKNEEEQK